MKTITFILAVLLSSCVSKVHYTYPAVRVHENTTAEQFRVLQPSDRDPEHTLGLWVPHEDGSEDIYVAGPLGSTAWILVHEYQHHLEEQLTKIHDDKGLKAARHAFRMMMTSNDEFGYNDLLKEIQ